jgi:hypothetical protein
MVPTRKRKPNADLDFDLVTQHHQIPSFVGFGETTAHSTGA